jgi:hypothetical protein
MISDRSTSIGSKQRQLVFMETEAIDEQLVFMETEAIDELMI